MQSALEEGSFENLRGEAHSIKGGAWNLEIRKLGDKARDLEDSSRESRRKESKQYLGELEEYFREFLAVAKEKLEL
jgi:HPt (histidine-containing phosphotransfer) domain-containing protein